MAGKQAKKTDWTPEMEARFQSVFKPYPNHSAAGEAREEFAKINPNCVLLLKMSAALEWQIPAYVERARRAGTVRVVPHFRRWLHHRFWEDDEVDDFSKPAPKEKVQGDCVECGFPKETHAFANSRVGKSYIQTKKDFAHLAVVCGEWKP